MNDPHVKALTYTIKHDDSVDYTNARPFSREEDGFSIRATGTAVRFRFHAHYATPEDAKRVIDEYIRAWEFDAQLSCGPDAFTLTYSGAEVVDRKPLGRPTRSLEFISRAGLKVEGSLHVCVADLPRPPRDIVPCPDAETMHRRYMGYLLGREPLPSMAYFCLTVLEGMCRMHEKKRTSVADKLSIDPRVLEQIGRLSSTKGDAEARKGEGVGNPICPSEQRFLEEAIKRIIRRVAEIASCPDSRLDLITLADLPSIGRDD